MRTYSDSGTIRSGACSPAGDEVQPGRGHDLAVGAAHQADVAVQVHRLVRLGRERGEALALEARHLGAEGPGEAAVELRHPGGVDLLRLGVGGGAQGAADHREVGRQFAEHVGGEERLVVVGHVVLVAEAVDPATRVFVLAGERVDLVGGGRQRGVDRDLEALQRAVEAAARLREQALDLAGQRLGGVEQLARAGVARVRRVVDEQDDAQVGVLLQRGREQRHQDHPGLLLVGGDQRGDRGAALGEELVQHRPRRAAAFFGPVVEAEPAEEVGGRRGGEQADRGEEADRLGEAGVAGDPFDHLAVDHGDHQRRPGGDGEDDGGAADRHRPVAGDPRHLRHRVQVFVGAPLAARAGVLVAAEEAHRFRLLSSARPGT